MKSGPVIWTGYYDVVIVPPYPIQTYAIEISRRLAKLGGKWKLGRRRFIPHISLYHIPVHPKDWDKFNLELRRLAKEARPAPLQLVGFDMPVLQTSKPAWLDALQRKVVLRTVPYFNRSYGAEEAWGLDFFAGRRKQFAKEYIRRYGTPMFGMNFRPHITLTSFKGKESPSDFKIDVKPFQFTPDHIAICELGESHSCQRVLERISLGSKGGR